MQLMTVVGARPQFIKAAVVSREMRRDWDEFLVHTGQHFDAGMSDIFFEQLQIPRPDLNLGISGGSHGQMTARMLAALEETMLRVKPRAVLVFGDTNSTLAAALAAVKLGIPVLHVESGNRFGVLSSPEEVNRVVTDHVSSLRFACTESALESLKKEDLGENSVLSGDPMLDAFLHFRELAAGQEIRLQDLNGKTVSLPDNYYYMTCHRQENTDTPEKLAEILQAANSLDAPAVYPVHPRCRAMLSELDAEHHFGNVLTVQPVGYLESVRLTDGAKAVLTDSGGLQREAFFAGKACVTVLDFVAWPETMAGGRNRLARPDHKDILEKLSLGQTVDAAYQPFGNGQAAQVIRREAARYL